MIGRARKRLPVRARGGQRHRDLRARGPREKFAERRGRKKRQIARKQYQGLIAARMTQGQSEIDPAVVRRGKNFIDVLAAIFGDGGRSDDGDRCGSAGARGADRGIDETPAAPGREGFIRRADFRGEVPVDASAGGDYGSHAADFRAARSGDLEEPGGAVLGNASAVQECATVMSSTPGLVLVLLTAITAIAILARRLALPYPIAFTLGGVALAFIPNVPQAALDPNLIFVLILPPLLFAGGWSVDLEETRKNLRAILLLSTGLVVATTVCVAYAAENFIPGMTLASAFVLGAVVSPPDAVAASSVFERFSVPRRILTVLEGEGLVNDATALVIYGFAVAAVTTGTFTFLKAGLAFVGVSVGGVLCGIALGYLLTLLIRALHKKSLSDSLIDNLVGLLGPYGVYLCSGQFHVSSVLATVTAGLYVSRRSSSLYSPEARLTVSAVWELMTFLLNAGAFLLIGLQLRRLVPDRAHFHEYVLWGTLVSAIVIAVRLIWVFPGAYLPRLLPAVRRNEELPPKRAVLVIGWSGMRGVVSLAAALSLPLRTAAGDPFPERDLIIFLTFCVIFATLVGQGLTLIPLLSWLKLDGEDLAQREIEVRISALEAALRKIHGLEAHFDSVEEWEVAGRIIFEYTYRIDHLRGTLEGRIETGSQAIDHRLQKAALEAEHDEVLRLRNAGEIPDEIFRKIRYDLDLATARLA